MLNYTNNLNGSLAFLTRSSLMITALGVSAITPFCLYNFFIGNTWLGIGSLLIIVLCSINIRNCLRNCFNPKLILYGIAPCIILFLVFTIHQLGVMGALWTYPAVLCFYFMLPKKQAYLADAILFLAVSTLLLLRIEAELAIRFIATIATTSVLAGTFINTITKQQEALSILSITDSLTGLPNRVGLFDYIKTSQHQSKRHKLPMAMLMLDIDYFKKINDSYGHPIGDQVLIGLGHYFKNRLRASDKLFRIGGEEFLAILYATDQASALSVAQTMCKEIEALILLPESPVTVSIGVAILLEDDDQTTWMSRADKKLYQAKSQGRNRAVA